MAGETSSIPGGSGAVPDRVSMIVMLPVYRPDHPLLDLIDDLRAVVPDAGVVGVDDGSDGPAADAVLRAARSRGCTLLRLRRNRGKGVALRVGFRYAADLRPARTVVYADADGQHRAADIVRVATHAARTGRLTLGTRRFEGTVPLRSRVGNELTRVLFHAATGRPVRDTQTGLRAHPPDQLRWLGRLPGDHFDYEMNVLLAAIRAGHRIEEVDIPTIYLNDNASSHFGALADSARIYRSLLRFGLTARLGAAS